MNKLDYFWKPVYLWLKYFFIVIIGKTPIIEKYNGTTYNIHPAAIRNLQLNLDMVTFDCSIMGQHCYIETEWSDIKYFGAE